MAQGAPKAVRGLAMTVGEAPPAGPARPGPAPDVPAEALRAADAECGQNVVQIWHLQTATWCYPWAAPTAPPGPRPPTQEWAVPRAKSV